MLQWDEVEVISALEAIPEVDANRTRYEFQVPGDELALNLVIEPDVGDVYFKLYCGESKRPILSLRLINCTRVASTRDKSGEALVFEPARMFGDQYRYDVEPWVRAGVRLAVRPHIMIEVF
ncbi:MAG TPA: hypothetical protein VF707_06960 [Ardenticatenaceae bacterium]